MKTLQEDIMQTTAFVENFHFAWSLLGLRCSILLKQYI